jgi:hypothetical protein
LVGLLGASYALGRLLPGVQILRSISHTPIRSGLVLIEDANNETSPRTISAGQFRAWNASRQEFFDGFAFYRLTKEDVSREGGTVGSRESERWQVAQASANFFSLLGLRVQLDDAVAGPGAGEPGVILSESAWRRRFGADPHVAGKVVLLGPRRATIVGVAPEERWGLPGNIDAWVLEPGAQAVPSGAGYVVAHLSPSGRSKMRGFQVLIQSYAPHRSPDDMLGIALHGGMPALWQVFLFAAVLGFLALPAVTSMSVSDSSISLHEVAWRRRLLRSSFLFAKIALLLPTVYFGAIDVAYGYTAFNAYQALYAQLVITFFGCLFGISWALSDQRRRCPVCLRRVSHPARVGQFSRTFLGWSGTELMCPGGHTLLHVPSLPTSWFSTQRWMFLDPSWQFLFVDAVRD